MNRNKSAAVLLGPPGSGKTTLARSLSGVHGVSVIETGNLLKREVRRQTALGRKIQPYTDSGDLAPSELVEKVLSEHVKGIQGNLFLFDGFPRCVSQTEPFFRLLKDQQIKLCAVLVLTLDLQTAIKRLSGRRICATCGSLYHLDANPSKQPGICDRCGGKLIQRDDDRPDVIQERFAGYHRETVPVIECFRTECADLIWEESSTTPLDEIVDQIGQRLEHLCRI
jgi:adenylate kinase